MVVSVPQDWVVAIEDYTLFMRTADRSPNTIRARREQLQHMARRIGAGPWEVTPVLLARYVGSQTWSTETRRSRYAGFREFWRWAKREGLIELNPSKRLPLVKPAEPNPDPVPLLDYEPAVRSADPRTALMMRLAHDAGLRRAEIAVVHSDDLRQDLLGWSLLVHGKGGKLRLVPLTPRLALDLRSLEPGYAFPGAIDGHLSPRRVGELLRDALPGRWTGHKLRHSYGSNVHEKSGGDVLLTQAALGHANPNTTIRYVKPSDHRLRAAVYSAAGYAAPDAESAPRRLRAV